MQLTLKYIFSSGTSFLLIVSFKSLRVRIYTVQAHTKEEILKTGWKGSESIWRLSDGVNGYSL